MANPPGEVTARLGEMKLGSKDALTRLIPLVYRKLRRLAGHYMRDVRASHTGLSEDGSCSRKFALFCSASHVALMITPEGLGAHTGGFGGRELQQSECGAIQVGVAPLAGHQAVPRVFRSTEQHMSEFVRNGVP
jgi:hypothetical protein